MTKRSLFDRIVKNVTFTYGLDERSPVLTGRHFSYFSVYPLTRDQHGL